MVIYMTVLQLQRPQQPSLECHPQPSQYRLRPSQGRLRLPPALQIRFLRVAFTLRTTSSVEVSNLHLTAWLDCNFPHRFLCKSQVCSRSKRYGHLLYSLSGSAMSGLWPRVHAEWCSLPVSDCPSCFRKWWSMQQQAIHGCSMYGQRLV